MGHLWDHARNYHNYFSNSPGLNNELFEQLCNLPAIWFNILPSDGLFKTTNEGGGVPVSSYAIEGGKGEDWAESWAAYFFRGDWSKLQGGFAPFGRPRERPDQTRLDYVEQEILEYKLLNIPLQYQFP